jgi:sirohydrochlorin ferrochelatase
MTTETLLLIGRESRNTREVLATHAERLATRTAVDDVEVATYENEPIVELREQFDAIAADTVYAVPMCAAHSHETIDDVPAALSYCSGDVRYCEPIGRSPAVTDVIAERGTDLASAGEDVSLVLVGFGSSSKPYNRQAVEYHAARLREESNYAAVHTCYLLQNPAVECVRYNVGTERAVAVPLFVTRTEATETRVPAALELDRGGIEYASPFGTHERITDAVEAEVAKQRALSVGADSPPTTSFEDQLPRRRRPVATDGDGGQR